MNRRHPSLSTPRRTQGFTLIELLVVIAIIGILAAILIPSYAGAQKRPYDVASLQCGKAVVTAQITYQAEHGNVPANSLSQINNSDVTEQCRNVQVNSDGAAPHVIDGGDGKISIAGNTPGANYAFLVWSQNGNAVYYYNRDGGQRFQRQN